MKTAMISSEEFQGLMQLSGLEFDAKGGVEFTFADGESADRSGLFWGHWIVVNMRGNQFTRVEISRVRTETLPWLVWFEGLEQVLQAAETMGRPSPLPHPVRLQSHLRHAGVAGGMPASDPLQTILAQDNIALAPAILRVRASILLGARQAIRCAKEAQG